MKTFLDLENDHEFKTLLINESLVEVRLIYQVKNFFYEIVFYFLNVKLIKT
jgi:hypothetical protein